MNKKIEYCLEKICQQGCEYVYKVIKGQIIDDIKEFDLADREKILLELKQIMNCYK